MSRYTLRMTRSASRLALSLAVLASVVAPLLVSAQYKVIKTVKVGGEGGSDYVYADSDARRLYVARSGSITTGSPPAAL